MQILLTELTFPLFDTSGFMPHGHCFLWTPAVLWSYVAFDGAIAAAYFSIPWLLFSFARKRPDMPMRPVLVMFGVFIVACGSTHAMAVWNIWTPDYWLDISLKGCTAVASVLTALTLRRLMPFALQLPSPSQLQELNRALELRVADRTVELETANRELRIAVDAQDVLLKEVYHRVKNNLQVVISLFNLQVRSLPPGIARACLEDGANRVHSMALVHEMLYQSGDLSRINLSTYLKELCARLGMAFNATQRGVALVAGLESLEVSLDRAVSLGLILNELITNSLKHGFPEGRTGLIRVNLHAVGDGAAEVEVWDDGIGFRDLVHADQHRSLGLKLVATLAAQLDAVVHTEDRSGAYTRLSFAVL